MSQYLRTAMFGFMFDSQYLPLTACPSLVFISLHDSAASLGMEPRGTGIKTKRFNLISMFRTFAMNNYIQFTSVNVSSEIISVWVRNEILRSGFLGPITKLTHAERHRKVETLASIICTTD